MKYVYFLLTLFALITQSNVAKCDIVWEFNSNDGTNFLTGRLTTDGNLADLAVDQTFNLKSFDSVTIQILPGLPEALDSDSDWVGGNAPPFTSSASGSILWDVDTMTAEVAGNNIFAATPGNTDYVQIGRVGADVFTDTGFNPDGGNRYLQFLPNSNSFAPIPEPSSIFFVSLIAGFVAALGIRRRVITRD